MALIKCPECSKDISSIVKSCPHCGFPMENQNIAEDTIVTEPKDNVEEIISEPIVDTSEENKPPVSKKTVNKKVLGIIIGIIAVLLVAGLIVFFVTANDRKYTKAKQSLLDGDFSTAVTLFTELDTYNDSAELLKQSIYEQAKFAYDNGEYQEAKDLFSQLKDYKDSLGKLEKCEFMLSIDGQFIADFAKGLEERWGIPDKDEDLMEADEFKTYRIALIDCELNLLAPYKEKSFNDEQLGNKAHEYVALLEQQKKALDYYSIDFAKFSEMWGNAYNRRSVYIADLLKNYDITISDEFESIKQEFLSNAVVVQEEIDREQEIVDLIESVKFEITQDSYGYKEYEATVTNTTNHTFQSFGIQVTLIDSDGVKLESTYTNQLDNFASGDKGKFTFMTDLDFTEMILTANYYIN